MVTVNTSLEEGSYLWEALQENCETWAIDIKELQEDIKNNPKLKDHYSNKADEVQKALENFEKYDLKESFLTLVSMTVDFFEKNSVQISCSEVDVSAELGVVEGGLFLQLDLSEDSGCNFVLTSNFFGIFLNAGENSTLSLKYSFKKATSKEEFVGDIQAIGSRFLDQFEF